MRGRRRRDYSIFVAVCVVTLAATVGLLENIVSGKVPTWIPTWIWVLLLLLGLVLTVVVQARERGDRGLTEDFDEAVERAAKDLRTAAKKQWADEVDRLGLNSVDRLPISWTPAAPRLFSSEAQTPPLAAAAPAHDHTGADERVINPAALAGNDLELARLWFTGVRSRRLVLLGDAGSGKTQLLYRLMSLLLDREEPDGKVPVLIPATSWDPHLQSVSAWVVDWLSTNYSFLSRRAPGPGPSSLGEALFYEGKLALMVDGLDELPADLARRAVRRLDAEVPPGRYLLVSSRTGQYYRDVVSAGSLDSALCATLDAQNPETVLAYLRSHTEPERWAAVAEAIGKGHPIGEVLQTPLMVMLADAIYNRDGPPDTRPQPAELLDRSDAAAVEDRLLDGFIEQRYTQAANQVPWRLADVRHWLGYFASGSPNLAWWDLPVWQLTPRHRRLVRHVVTPLVVLLWTAISTFVTYSLIMGEDVNRGATNAVRISLAAIVVYAAVLYLSASFRAALLAVLGAYIAGVLSGIYDHAVVAGLAAGLCWPRLRLVRAGLGDAFAVGSVAASIPVLVRLGGVLFPAHPEKSLVQGFAGGFADGWVNRWDPDWNGYVGILAIATSMVLVVTRLAPRAENVRERPLPFARRCRFPTGSPLANAAVVGLAVTVLGVFSDGHQDHVVHGWLLAPADGFAVGFLIWYLSSWWRRRIRTVVARAFGASGHAAVGRTNGRRRRAVVGRVVVPVLTGAASGVLNLLAYLGHDNIPRPWANALADAVVIALLTWYLLGSPPQSRSSPRPAGRSMTPVEVVKLGFPPLFVGFVTGGLDAFSAGAPGIAYGLAAAGIALCRRLHYAGRWKREPYSEWKVRPEEAGLVVTVLVGIVAQLGYALLYGLTVTLAIRVALAINGRTRPSTSLLPSNAGIVGGAILGSLVAFGASFSRIGTGWAVPIGVASAAAAMFAFGTEGNPASEKLVLSPRRLLALDRWAFLRTTLGLAITIGLAAGTWTAARYGLGTAALTVVGTTVTYGVTAGLVVAAAQCRFGHYTVRRYWLAANGMLPWRLMTFLDDAYDKRDVLRRNGTLYQFRHERMQGRLAKTYDPFG